MPEGRDGVRVGVIGAGSIGREVARALADGRVPGAELGGVLRRSSEQSGSLRPVHDIDELIDVSDLVVEAAGHAAVRQYGHTVLNAGRDLLVVSVGVLADDELFSRLRSMRVGRLILTTGAVGGLDVLSAANRCAGLTSVTLETRKFAGALHRSWMDPRMIAKLMNPTGAFQVFSGSARAAARQFPQTSNVAATVALSTIGFDRVHVTVIAVPVRGESVHAITAEGPSGKYEFRIRNVTAPGNAKTSWITPHAVLRGISTYVGANLVL